MRVTVTRLFWDDHSDRFADAKEFEWDIIKENKNTVVVNVNKAEYDNLKSDAEYYANPIYDLQISKGLRLSARATLLRLNKRLNKR